MFVFNQDNIEDPTIYTFIKIIKEEYKNKSYYEIYTFLTTAYRNKELTKQQFNLTLLKIRDIIL